jgi:hypothetical protein
MLSIASVLCVVLNSEPTPGDIHRFGFSLGPVTQSVPREVWSSTQTRLRELREVRSRSLFNHDILDDLVADALWRERVWDAVDDLSRDCCSLDSRKFAAQRLKRLLGPIDYLRGALPPSHLELEQK